MQCFSNCCSENENLAWLRKLLLCQSSSAPHEAGHDCASGWNARGLFNYHLCRHPHHPHESQDVSWAKSVSKAGKLGCPWLLVLPVWMLHLPGQSCLPAQCMCTVLSMEGEGRAEIKWLGLLPPLVSCFSLTGLPSCLSLVDLFCNQSPHPPAVMLHLKGKGITNFPRKTFSSVFSACHVFTGKHSQGRRLLCQGLYSIGTYQIIKPVLIKTGWAGTGAIYLQWVLCPGEWEVRLAVWRPTEDLRGQTHGLASWYRILTQ